MFSQTDFMIFIAALCGLVMVCGAFVLLYLGTIKLEPPAKNAIATELTIYKIIKIKTNIASVVLFVIGFAFLWLGFNHTEAAPLEIRGKVWNIQPNEYVTVSVCGGPWIIPVQNNGDFVEFDDKIKPALDQFQVQIGKVGVLPEKTFGLLTKPPIGNPYKVSTVLYIRNNLASLGEIHLEQPAPPPPALVDKVANAPVPKVDYAAHLQ